MTLCSAQHRLVGVSYFAVELNSELANHVRQLGIAALTASRSLYLAFESSTLSNLLVLAERLPAPAIDPSRLI